MKVAFDGTTLTPGQTGIGYYTEHLLHALLEVDESLDLRLISNQETVTSLPLKWDLPVSKGIPLPLRIPWMQSSAPHILYRGDFDLAHFTNSMTPLVKTVPYVVTIHDMTLQMFPEYHPWHRLLTRPLIEWSARRADAIITVSESARKDIQRVFGIPSSRIHRIYEAPSRIFRPVQQRSQLDEVRRRYGLSESFVLSVGTIEPRKNLVRLIEAFQQVVRKGSAELQLIFAGRFGWGYQEILRRVEELGLGSRVKMLGYVPLTDLPIIYSLCTVLAYPSLYEGFGLPPIEAMACCAPVVVSRNSCFEEVLGNAAELVDPISTSSLTEALYRLTTDESYRSDLRKRGLVRARRFSWSETARRTLDVYKSVLRESLS